MTLRTYYIDKTAVVIDPYYPGYEAFPMSPTIGLTSYFRVDTDGVFGTVQRITDVQTMTGNNRIQINIVGYHTRVTTAIDNSLTDYVQIYDFYYMPTKAVYPNPEDFNGYILLVALTGVSVPPNDTDRDYDIGVINIVPNSLTLPDLRFDSTHPLPSFVDVYGRTINGTTTGIPAPPLALANYAVTAGAYNLPPVTMGASSSVAFDTTGIVGLSPVSGTNGITIAGGFITTSGSPTTGTTNFTYSTPYGHHRLSVVIPFPNVASGTPKIVELVTRFPFFRVNIAGMASDNAHVWYGEHMEIYTSMSNQYFRVAGYVTTFIISPRDSYNDGDAIVYKILYIPAATNVNSAVMATNTISIPSDSISWTITIYGEATNGTADAFINLPFTTSYYSGVPDQYTPYTDVYGRIITSNSHVGVVAGMFNDQITLQRGSSVGYYQIQNYWRTGSTISPHINFTDNAIYSSNSVVPGTYTYYVSTVRGHTLLTITIEDPSEGEQIELTQYVYDGVNYDLGDASIQVPGVITNGIINTNQSQKVTHDGMVYNIIVLPKPDQIAVTVIKNALYTDPINGSIQLRTFNYSVYDILNLNPSIPITAITFGPGIAAGSTAFAASWDLTAAPPSNTTTITVLGYVLGLITVDQNVLTVSDVFAVVGNAFDLKDYIHSLDEVQSINVFDDSGTPVPSSSYEFRGTSVTIKADGNYAHIRIAAVLSGALVQIPLGITVIGSNTVEIYLTAETEMSVFKVSENRINDVPTIILQSPEGSRISLTAPNLIITPFSSTLCDVRIDGLFFAIKVKKPCLFLGKLTVNAVLQGVSALISPVDEIAGTDPIYVTHIPDVGTNTVELTLPAGPTYNIVDANNHSTIYSSFTGGTQRIDLPAVNTYHIVSTNYNGFPPSIASEFATGIDFIELRVVSAHTKRFGFVHTRTITGYTFLSPMGTTIGTSSIEAITYSGSNITVSSGNLGPIIASLGGEYFTIEFYRLPVITSQQTIYYVAGNKYQEVLPSIGYEYTGIDTTLVVPSNPSPIAFDYGELSGTITLVEFSGASSQVKIYDQVVLNGTTFSRTLNGTPEASPFNASTYVITQTGSTVTITVNASAVGQTNIPELFVTNNGVTTLYTFYTLPRPNIPDKYVFGTGTVQWTVDVPCVLVDNTGAPIGGPYTIGMLYSFGSGQTKARFAINTASGVVLNGDILYSDYGPYSSYPPEFCFQVHNLEVHKATINILELDPNNPVTLTPQVFTSFTKLTLNDSTINSIISYGATPQSMKSFSTQDILELATSRVTVMQSSLSFVARTLGNSMLYIEASFDSPVIGGGTTQQIVALDVIVTPLPYKGTLTIEYLSDTNDSAFIHNGSTQQAITNNAGPAYELFPSDTNVTSYNIYHQGDVTPYTVLAPGKNSIQYKYYGLPTTGWINADIIVKEYPNSGSFNTTHTMHTGEQLNVNLVMDLFGQTTGYKITQVGTVVNINSSTALSTPTFTDQVLSLVTNRVTMAQTETFTFPVTIRIPNDSLALLNTEVIVNITVIVWDPDSVEEIILKAQPNDVATPFIVDSQLNGNLLRIEYQGAIVYDNSITNTTHRKLDWSDIGSETDTNRTLRVKSAVRVVDQYIFFTSTTVYIVGVIAIENNLGPLVIPYVPAADSASSVNGSGAPLVDLIMAFLPALRDQLVELDIKTDNTVPTPRDLTSINVEGAVNATATLGYYKNNSTFVSVTTFTYTGQSVEAPNVVGSDLTFVTPIRQVLKIKSTEVSYDSKLIYAGVQPPIVLPSLVPPYRITTVDDGIELYFEQTQNQAANDELSNPENIYTITTRLIKSTVRFLDKDIKVLAYDPADTVPLTYTIYTTQKVITLPSTIISYIYNGVNYGLNASAKALVSGSTISVTMTPDEPRVVFSVRLDNGKLYLVEVVYVKPATTGTKIHLFGTASRLVTATDFTDVLPPALRSTNEQTTNMPTIAFDTTGLLPNGAGRYDIYSAGGLKVGEVDISSGVRLYPSTSNVGVWTGFSLILYNTVLMTTELLRFSPYVETVGPPLLQNQEIVVHESELVSIDLSRYVVNNTGHFIFNLGYAPFLTTYPLKVNDVPTPIPSYIVMRDNIISTTSAFATLGIYEFTAKVTDIRDTSLTPLVYWFTLKLVVIKDGVDTIGNIILVGLQQQEIVLTGNAIKVEVGSASVNVPVTGTADIAGMRFARSPTGTYLFINSLFTSLSPAVITVLADDGSRSIYSVTQVKSIKDLNVGSLEYKGSVFDGMPGYPPTNPDPSPYIVVSATRTPSINIPLDDNTVTPAGKIYINSDDGTYDISWNSAVTITVTYRTRNGTENNTRQFTFNGQQHLPYTIERLPPPVIDLGGVPLKLFVDNQPLAEGQTLDLTYARFTRRGDKLLLDGVTTLFDDTLVQWEIESNVITVQSMMLTLKSTVNEQTKYTIIESSIVEIALPYEPYMVTYDTMVLSGSDDAFDIYGRVGHTKIGSLSISGSSLQITASTVIDSDITMPIGLISTVNGKEQNNYIVIEVVKRGRGTVIDLSLGSTYVDPDALSFVTIGMLDQSEPPAGVGETLASRVTNNGGSLLVLIPPVVTETFMFYAIMSDGTMKLFRIAYVEQEIFVSDMTKIPLAAVTTKVALTYTFTEGSVSVVGGNILNPSSLPIINMITPKRVKIIINQL